jgi:hypothetical protein
MARGNDWRAGAAAHRADTPPKRDATSSPGGVEFGGILRLILNPVNGRRAVAVRGAAQGRRWGARGVATCAGSPTSGQLAPRGAAGHGSADRPERRRHTSGASTRPIGTRQSGRAVHCSRSCLPWLPPRAHRLRLRSPERSPRATGHGYMLGLKIETSETRVSYRLTRTSGWDHAWCFPEAVDPRGARGK